MQVCEVGLLILLGLTTSNHLSRAPGQWQRCKKEVCGIPRSMLNQMKSIQDVDYRRRKLMHAKAWIQEYASTGADTTPEGSK
jgi:hypothetical protein